MNKMEKLRDKAVIEYYTKVIAPEYLKFYLDKTLDTNFAAGFEAGYKAKENEITDD